MEALFSEIHPVFQKNDHTAAELLLYPQGFQQDTPSADDEIFTALAGDPFKPGIQGFLPELSAGLYITNGDFTDWAYNRRTRCRSRPRAPRPRTRCPGSSTRTRRSRSSRSSERHLPFALDLAQSAEDPASPSRTWTTRPRTSLSTRSPSPTATRSPSARRSSASSAR